MLVLPSRTSGLLALAATALFTVSSCSCMRPITDRPMIGGRPARRVVVVLKAPFSFTHFLVTYTLPAGRYTPAWEDDAGVYFEAPAKVLGKDLLAAPSIYEGGLYFRADGSREIDEYILVRNQPLFITVPADLPYSLSE